MTRQSRAPGAAPQRNSTADRTLDILGLFDDGTLRVSAGEVATVLDVARSTAYRYLESLVGRGFLEEDPRGGFRLGLRILELARLARRSYGLSEVALPVMSELSAAVGETVLLTRLSAGRVVCLERVEAASSVRISYERGAAFRPNAGASSLILLAGLPDAEARAVLEESALPRYTDRTIVDSAAQLARLAGIRGDGHAITRGELDEDVLGVAVPVRGVDGGAVAAVGVAAVGARVPDDRVPEIVAATRRAADRISAVLAAAE